MPADVVYLRREKVILDTSIYISHLQKGLYGELILHLVRSSIPYLHSTVFEELLAGAFSQRERRELERLKKPFLSAGRFLTPTYEDWEETGLLVNRLIGKGGVSPAKAVSLTHDVLIALSARRMGVRVITENRGDFERIHHHKEFKLTVWSPENQTV